MGEETAENLPQNAHPEVADEWVVKAWRLWAGGLKNWSAIGRSVGHDRETCKKRVMQYQKTLSALYDDPDSDPRVEVLEGYSQDLQAQLTIALQAESVSYDKDGGAHTAVDYSTRSRARKEVTAIRTLAAGVRGVVTEKKSVQVGGDPKNPVVVEHDINPASVAETIAILDRVGARGPGGGDPGSDPETDEVHPGDTEPEAGGVPVPE